MTELVFILSLSRQMLISPFINRLQSVNAFSYLSCPNTSLSIEKSACYFPDCVENQETGRLGWELCAALLVCCGSGDIAIPHSNIKSKI